MNKRQLEVEKVKLAAEARKLNELKAIYQKAADDISKKIRISDGKINVLLQNFDDLDDKQKSILQSQIYQRKFQQSLKQQIDDFTNALVAGQYESINDYMRSCYEVGFLGAMYDLHGQGVPLVMPIDEKKVIMALQTNSKISKRLYTKLGEDVDALKKRIASSLSRGIATADSYANIARNIASDSNVGFNRAMRIARTEGHRIQANSAYDAQLAAKAAGADIVKEWDASLDGKTRPHHRQLDGQIRELEEPFEIGGMEAMYPSGFGSASEDINCRCALLQRARWALEDDEFTKMNNFTKELETFKSPKSYSEFKKGFFSDGNVKYMNYVQQMEKKHKTKDFRKLLDRMTESEYQHFSKLLANNPVLNTKSISDIDPNDFIVLDFEKTKDGIAAYSSRIKDEYNAQNLTQKEHDILWKKDGGYIQNGQGYKDINKYMRGLTANLDNPECAETIKTLIDVTNKNSLTQNYVGYRKVACDYLQDIMGIDISGKARGIGTRMEAINSMEDAKQIASEISKLIGTESGRISDKAVTSISLSEKINAFKHRPIEFEIQIPKGTKGLITDNYKESEFIAKPDSTLELYDVKVYNLGDEYDDVPLIKIFARLKQD